MGGYGGMSGMGGMGMYGGMGGMGGMYDSSYKIFGKFKKSIFNKF